MFLVFATHRHTLPRLGGWLDVGEPARRSDFLMILNGDYQTRPFAAAQSYQQGFAQKIVITSVADSNRQKSMPRTHAVVRSIVNRCGVPDDDILFVDAQCRSTFDEALVLRDLTSKNPNATFCVVTNEYHTRRARWTIQNVLGTDSDRVHLLSAKTDFYSAANWWKHEDGFVWYCSEFAKLGFYWLRYGNGLIWTAVALVVTSLICVLPGRWPRRVAEG